MAAIMRARTALLTVAGGVLAVYGLRRTLTKRAALPLSKGEITISRSQILQAPKDEVYRRWSSYESLPSILKHIEKVEILDDKRQRWTAKLLAHGPAVEWIAEVVAEVPGQRIAWRSIQGAPVTTSGEVLFSDVQGGEATRLDVHMSYQLPMSKVGAAVGRALKPAIEEEVRADLRRFQAEVEAGEVPTTLGQPAGHGRRHGIALIDKIGGAS